MPDDRFFPHVSLLPQVVHAGFPSPGDDYAEPSLNLHDRVVPQPNSTYFIKVSGDSMNGACIRAGDIVVVFFLNNTATTKIYTLPLHDPLPIYAGEPPPPFEVGVIHSLHEVTTMLAR